MKILRCFVIIQLCKSFVNTLSLIQWVTPYPLSTYLFCPKDGNHLSLRLPLSSTNLFINVLVNITSPYVLQSLGFPPVNLDGLLQHFLNISSTVNSVRHFLLLRKQWDVSLMRHYPSPSDFEWVETLVPPQFSSDPFRMYPFSLSLSDLSNRPWSGRNDPQVENKIPVLSRESEKFVRLRWYY